MEKHFHTLQDLFRQLGLPDEPAEINRFIVAHKPLPAGMAVCDAPFWSSSQAQFLRENLRNDADWAEIVDALSLALRD